MQALTMQVVRSAVHESNLCSKRTKEKCAIVKTPTWKDAAKDADGCEEIRVGLGTVQMKLAYCRHDLSSPFLSESYGPPNEPVLTPILHLRTIAGSLNGFHAV